MRLLLPHTIAALLLAACGARPEPEIPLAVANDNRVAAGTGDDVRVVSLVARAARWAPDGDSLGKLDVEAFAEEGKGPSVPGPLVRVRRGARLRLSVRNALRDTLVLCGLAGRACARGDDSVRVAPNAIATFDVRADVPGTYFYWGAYAHEGGRRLTRGPGGQLVGAYLVDSAPPPVGERVLVMTTWMATKPIVGSDTPFVMGINGRTWPSTERLAYAVGDTVRWRVLSASGADHPMHLHGTYFRVDARGSRQVDTAYSADARRWVVTENLPPMSSMAVTWVPPRAGRWLFHCHRALHMSAGQKDYLAGRPRPAMWNGDGAGSAGAAHDHATSGMAGLVMGVTVTGPPNESAAPDTGPARRLRLLVQRRAGHYGAQDAMGYVLHEGGAEPARDSVSLPGPTLALRRGEPVEITVVNRLDHGTAVHWHGVELASYYDGVPGWSGAGGPATTTPMIAPGDSFVARFAPPRAGTFIYHTHTNEYFQLASGMYGALLVLDAPRDAAADHVLLLGQDGPSDSGLVVLNGAARPRPIDVRAGMRQRLRLVNIIPQDMAQVELRAADSALVRWTPVAKDGADLPAAQRVSREARVLLGPGETFDVEVVPRRGDLRLHVRSFNDFSVPLRAR